MSITWAEYCERIAALTAELAPIFEKSLDQIDIRPSDHPSRKPDPKAKDGTAVGQAIKKVDGA
ncbi:MAG TPA: hypothetical protein VF493_05405 [Terriglobales bacterium]